MRNGAPLVVVLSLAVLVPSGLAAEDLMLTGKPASWETWGESPKPAVSNTTTGETLETPNERRRRLGMAVEASFPAAEQGVAEETPNHRRQRLSKEEDLKGLRLAGSVTETVAFGTGLTDIGGGQRIGGLMGIPRGVALTDDLRDNASRMLLRAPSFREINRPALN